MRIKKFACVALLSLTGAVSACSDQTSDDTDIAEDSSALSGEPRSWTNVETHRCLDSNADGSVYTLSCNEGDFQLSVPALALGQVYSPRQLAEFGVKQQTELSMPVFNWVF